MRSFCTKGRQLRPKVWCQLFRHTMQHQQVTEGFQLEPLHRIMLLRTYHALFNVLQCILGRPERHYLLENINVAIYSTAAVIKTGKVWKLSGKNLIELGAVSVVIGFSTQRMKHF